MVVTYLNLSSTMINSVLHDNLDNARNVTNKPTERGSKNEMKYIFKRQPKKRRKINKWQIEREW